MNDQEDDPDVYYISRGESHIDVADWIYEFINLSIPDAENMRFERKGWTSLQPGSTGCLEKNGTRRNRRKRQPDLERIGEI